VEGFGRAKIKAQIEKSGEERRTRLRSMPLNLFRTKSPEHLMAEAAAPERQLKRALSAFDLTCIGIGAICDRALDLFRL